MTKADFIDMVEQLQLFFSTSFVVLAHIHDPPMQAMLRYFVNNPNAGVHFNRSDGTRYDVHLHQTPLVKIGDPLYNSIHIRWAAAYIISTTYDTAKRNTLTDQSPEFEFLRHLRNGVSHGNIFAFQHGEPKRLAAFKQFTISPALQGQTILFDYIPAGDLFDLLDYIKTHV